ncbi:MAG TPA: sulfotransferase domain-containing protein [Pyrinomonadaceae bacterium]|nr:sulfotransferase domain-containing protein [Pyrinomonadaceae bacterium]
MVSAEQTIDVPDQLRNLYSNLQQEVDLGVRALERQDADVAATLFKSALEKLTVQQPFHDHLVHNLLLSYKLLIEQASKAGDTASAHELLPSALKLEIRGEKAADSDFLRGFAGAFNDLGLTFFRSRNYRASVECFRKAISVYPSTGAHVNLTNALTASGLPAVLSDFTDQLPAKELGRHLFIACVPKTASTFLKNVLVGLTGYRDVFMVYAAGQSEHEIYLPTLRETARLNTVTQQHCRASDANVQLMQAFRIRPIVLVRDIYDCVMSLLDFYDGGAYFNTYFRADFRSLDRETKIDLLIDNVVPWYLQFVSSWDLVEKQKRLDLMWLTYEELIGDKPAAVEKVLEFYGLGARQRDVEQKLGEIESEQRSIRFNKGVAGRGRSGLNDRQKAQVRRLIAYYPSTDFGRIGL